MLSKVVIVFLLAMVIVAMLGKALYGKSRQKLGKPPVCTTCGRYLVAGGKCDCGRKG